jgi:Polyketide cyclase / dehydrase and lipid transport
MRVRDVVSINPSVEEAFAYLDNPDNGGLIPSLVEVNEVTPLANGGHRLRFVALGRRGKRCSWVSEQIERVPNKLVVVHAHTEGITTIATRLFEPMSSGTRMATALEYRVELPWPQKLLTPLIEFQLRRQIRNQLRSLLALVKERVEAGRIVADE